MAGDPGQRQGRHVEGEDGHGGDDLRVEGWKIMRSEVFDEQSEGHHRYDEDEAVQALNSRGHNEGRRTPPKWSKTTSTM